MSIFSKLLEAINLGHKAKASPVKSANTSPFTIEKTILNEIPVFTKQVDSSVVTDRVNADIKTNVEQGMERQLRTRKFGIHFELTPSMRAIIQPEIAKNVSLLQDIPSQYFTEVEGLVMRAVAVGGDLKTLTDELHKRCGITLNRAGEIAMDQNRKINSVMTKTRDLELGITKAIWLHTQGGCAVKRTHPTAAEVRMSEAHKAFSGQTYDIAEGALIDGKRVWPGSESGCCCMSKPVMPDFMR
jgi:uncharacterized protein with gpF-like domain